MRSAPPKPSSRIAFIVRLFLVPFEPSFTIALQVHRSGIVRKLDIFNHIWPKPFQARLEQVCQIVDITKRSNDIPMMSDLDERFRVMDMFDEYQQVLSLASPPLEVVAGPKDAAELARIGNGEMAELVQRYPDRFPGFVASIAMSDMDGALAETRRAIDELGAVGVQIFTNVNGRPLDEP